jgi:hypothetical protein
VHCCALHCARDDILENHPSPGEPLRRVYILRDAPLRGAAQDEVSEIAENDPGSAVHRYALHCARDDRSGMKTVRHPSRPALRAGTSG